MIRFGGGSGRGGPRSSKASGASDDDRGHEANAATSAASVATFSTHSIDAGGTRCRKSHDIGGRRQSAHAGSEQQRGDDAEDSDAAASASVVTSPRDVVRVVAKSRQAVVQLEAMRKKRLDVDPQRLRGIELGVAGVPGPSMPRSARWSAWRIPASLTGSASSEHRQHLGAASAHPACGSAPCSRTRTGRPPTAAACS